MEIKLEIPSHLAGIVMSLEISELDSDRIIEYIPQSDRLNELIEYGLIYSDQYSDCDEIYTEYFLTRPGKLIYDLKNK